jgi:hypothetical protein
MNTPPWPPASPRPAAAATMLALTLCCGGCVRAPLRPSIQATPAGNAILATLPAGTRLAFPAPDTASAFRRLFASELRPEAPGGGLAPSAPLVLSQPLKICTPAYLAERDSLELERLRQVESLQLEIQSLRQKP